MRGLFYKNYLLARRQYIGILIMIVIFLFTGLIPSGNSWGMLYAVFILSTLPAAFLRADETSKWGQYCDILPLSRQDVVNSYYIGNYLILGAFILFYFAAASVVAAATGTGAAAVAGTGQTSQALGISGTQAAIIINVVWMIVLSFLNFALSFPVTLKFGTQKGYIVQIILIALVIFVTVGVFNAVPGDGVLVELNSQRKGTSVMTGALFFKVLFSLASWRASIRIYEKKDLG